LTTVESIISAKTGGCPEDCAFCSQSARYRTDVVREPMLPTAQLVELARRTRALGGTEFCIVVAVRGPDERMMSAVIDATLAIRAEVDIEVAASLGILKGRAGRTTRNGGHSPLQPQSRIRAALLPADLLDAHLRRAC
jgi:biotin synthase